MDGGWTAFKRGRARSSLIVWAYAAWFAASSGAFLEWAQLSAVSAAAAGGSLSDVETTVAMTAKDAATTNLTKVTE